jgi:hypothetical protein
MDRDWRRQLALLERLGRISHSPLPGTRWTRGQCAILPRMSRSHINGGSIFSRCALNCII